MEFLQACTALCRAREAPRVCQRRPEPETPNALWRRAPENPAQRHTVDSTVDASAYRHPGCPGLVRLASRYANVRVRRQVTPLIARNEGQSRSVRTLDFDCGNDR